MKIIQASFLWKNNQPEGLGFTFAPPGFTQDELTNLFMGDIVTKYKKDSDLALGSDVVKSYLAQLAAIGQMKLSGEVVSQEMVIVAAFNIMWLTERGFIPNDEFNGTQFIILLSDGTTQNIQTL